MSYAVDTNILIYASDRGSPFFERAAVFLKASIGSDDVMCLSWATVMAYLRIVTHPSLLTTPLTPDEAMLNMESLFQMPNVRVLIEDDGFWNVYRDVARDLVVRGNLVPDAHLAALLKQHGVTTLYTNDTGFRRFAFLKVLNPFDDNRR